MTGCVVWITGLPASGKSTLALATAAALRNRGASCVILDGDAVRAALVPSPGYDAPSRDHFYETLARLAALLADQQTIVLVPATAHERRFRERARTLAPSYVEVFTDTPLEECERRDPKGLYRGGDAASLPGPGVAYEPPLDPDLVVGPGDDHAADRLARLITGTRVAIPPA